MADDDTFVRITNVQIWKTLQDLDKSSDEMKTELREMRAEMSTFLAEQADMRKRIRGLELKFYAILAGLVMAIVALLNVSGVLRA